MIRPLSYLMITTLFLSGCIRTDPPPNPFHAPATYPVGKSPSFLGAADLNQDGILDLIVANTESQSISIFLAATDGSYQDAPALKSGKQPRWVVFGDFNEDRKTDLVVLNNDEDNLYVFMNQGKGTFGTPISYQVGRAPFSATVNDFNGDGHLDFAIVSRFVQLVILL